MKPFKTKYKRNREVYKAINKRFKGVFEATRKFVKEHSETSKQILGIPRYKDRGK